MDHHFRNVTFKSTIIPLPKEFIDYLNADGIYLPKDGQPMAASTIEELDSENEAEYENTTEEENIPQFPDIEQAIRKTIEEYGAVFPKLNWSSPRDAAWISATQTLKCTSPFDVYLLLKSSDFINHDLNHAFENCDEQQQQLDYSYHLILRKWHDLQPSLEFRCFVKHKELIGITQRDMTYYDFLPTISDELETKIYEFFEDYVRDGFDADQYVFDVYIQQDHRKVWLLDFNPFSPTTDSLLYNWDELLKFDTDLQEPEFRIIGSETEANGLTCTAPRFASNMVPKDVIDLSDGKSIAEFADDFQRIMALSSQQDDSDSD
ncbi:unnamed protein product [Cunninghamella blakesleeana]